VFGRGGAGNPSHVATRQPEEEQGLGGAARATARGRSERTPAFAISAVALVVFGFAALIVLVIFLLWQFV
jgi:hypothetical protein